MCLYQNSQLTKFYKSLNHPIVAFKQLKIRNFRFVTPYMHKVVRFKKNLEFSTESSIDAKGRCTGIPVDEMGVAGSPTYEWNEGIHAYIDTRCCNVYDEVLIPVIIYPEDILAVGECGDIVTKRIFFIKRHIWLRIKKTLWRS